MADPDILEERPESVQTGREIAEVEGEAPGWSSKTGRIKKAAATKASPTKAAPRVTGGHAKLRPQPAKAAPRKATPAKPDASTVSADPPDPSTVKGAKRGSLPAFVEPALATLVSTPPDGETWLHEIKFDG